MSVEELAVLLANIPCCHAMCMCVIDNEHNTTTDQSDCLMGIRPTIDHTYVRSSAGLGGDCNVEAILFRVRGKRTEFTESIIQNGKSVNV